MSVITRVTGDAQAQVVGDGGFEEGDGADGLLVGIDLREADARGIVDDDMHELPADAARVGVPGAIRGDAVADAFEAAELLDVDVDEPTRLVILVAPSRFGWLEVAHPGKPGPLEHPADGGWRDPKLKRDVLAGEPLPAKGHDLLDPAGWRRPVQPVRSGRTIRKTSRALCSETGQPLVHRADRHPQRRGNDASALSSRDPADKFSSIMRTQAGILVHVHSGRSWIPAVW